MPSLKTLSITIIGDHNLNNIHYNQYHQRQPPVASLCTPLASLRWWLRSQRMTHFGKRHSADALRALYTSATGKWSEIKGDDSPNPFTIIYGFRSLVEVVIIVMKKNRLLCTLLIYQLLTID